MNPMRILITGKLHDDVITTLGADHRISLSYQPDLGRQALLEAVADVEGLITRSETTIDRELMEKAPHLRLIVRAAVGVGNIDLDFATERGILVINTPGKNTNSAAELTMALLMALCRHVSGAHENLKNGGWDRHRFTGMELRGKKIGLVGLGNVGHRVAKFARGFDMEVYAYDPYINPDKFRQHHAHHCQSLEELTDVVDILSVHVPLNRETRGMVDAKLLKRLGPQGFVINAARGGIVSEEDLIAMLDAGQTKGAAIDTFEHEPTPLPQLIQHPLVVCTPHIGASTEAAQIAIGQSVVDQVTKFLNQDVVDHPVNLPEVKVIDKPVLKSYAVLIEKLGSLTAQLLDFNPQQATISYRGDIAELDTSILRLSFMKGYAGQRVDDYVSFVNASAHVEAMGLTVKESQDRQFEGYKSAVKILIEGDGTQDVLTVGGIVFDEQYMRISLVNGFYFEIEPSGNMILIENNDKPGVIGHVGMELGRQGVNISAFSLSRNSKGGNAMAIVCVDSAPTKESLAKLAGLENVLAIHAIRL